MGCSWMSPEEPLLLLLAAMLSLTFGETPCGMQGLQAEGYTRSGDFILGGIFPLHFSRFTSTFAFSELKEAVQCHTFRSPLYQRLLAMVFAIEEINQNPVLLPDATLGFWMYDSCGVVGRTLRGALWMLTGRGEIIPKYRCQKTPPLAAIIGDAASLASIPMARVLGLHRQPQISYGSTVSLLSDKQQFPSFLRTVPSDEYQSRVLADLIGHFGWTWVGIVAEESDYGQLGSQILKEELVRYSACAAFHVVLPVVYSERKINHVINVIKESRAKVVVSFSNMESMLPLLKEAARLNLTGKVWIASEGWAENEQFSDSEFNKVLNGSLRLLIQKSLLPGFRNFMLGIQPSHTPSDIFMRSFWEEVFDCQWPTNETKRTSTDLKHCYGTEELAGLNITFLDETKFNNAATAYKAVYAVAHALHNLRACRDGEGPFQNKSCADRDCFESWQLLYYVRNVNFRSTAGDKVFFDTNGNPPPAYQILNWKITAEGAAENVVVGTYQPGRTSELALTLNNSLIQLGGYEQIPKSLCSEMCTVGFRKSTREGQGVCCYDCIPCSDGEISNQTDSPDCTKCPDDQWSNEKRDHCIPKTIEFLSFQEPLGYILVAVTIASALVPIVILVVFFKHRETPIVKANNRTLSCLLLVTLSLCLLSTFLFLGHPTDITCMLRQVIFSILFVMCVSCLLAKTALVLMAFGATYPNTTLRSGFGPKVPAIIVFTCTLVQTLICVIWLVSSPPHTQRNMKSLIGKVVIECNEGSPQAFWCVLGYMGLLALASFLVAFRARKLPDSFNEAQLITFSMVTFLTVWTLFLPTYLNTKGKYMVAVEVFTIISSSMGIVVCIFFPKCYIILIRPDLNNRSNMKGKLRH